METLETILITLYYDYTPDDRPKKDRATLAKSRREVIAELESDHKLMTTLELELAKDYQVSIDQLRRMSDSDYHQLRERLVPSGR